MDNHHMDDDRSRPIDSGNRETARMDQDNEKNISTPKAGANREAGMRIEPGADDIDESKRNELAETRGDDIDCGTDLEQDADNRPGRDKQSP